MLAIKSKRAVLTTMRCVAGKCFLAAILATRNKKTKNRGRIGKYAPLFGKLNTKGLKFPVTLDQISRFETLNRLRIFVFGVTADGRTVFPLYLTKFKENKGDRERPRVDLLLHKNHFYCITNLSRLIGGTGNYKRHGRKHVCRSCMLIFWSKAKLLRHDLICPRNNNGQLYEVPEQTSLKFEQYSKCFPCDHVVYFDFETLVTDPPTNGSSSQSTIVGVHRPVAVCAKRVCQSNGELDSDLFLHVGTDCVDKFIDFVGRTGNGSGRDDSSGERTYTMERARPRKIRRCQPLRRLRDNVWIGSEKKMCGSLPPIGSVQVRAVRHLQLESWKNRL